MMTRLIALSIGATVVVANGAGCASRVAPDTLSVTSVSPSFAFTNVATPITILGTSFGSDTTLVIGNVVTAATVVSSTKMTAIAPPLPVGTVDVVVANSKGESRLTEGFNYVEPPTPKITSITPNLGSTEGGTGVTIQGSGVPAGATLTLDGFPVAPFVIPSFVFFLAPAHAPGAVDIVITNPDGKSVRAAGGYTYVLPETLDFNGTWDGYAGGEEILFQFRIENNTLTRLTCGTSAPRTFSPAPTVSHGEFSFNGPEGVIFGRIVGASEAIGTLDVAPCGALTWDALRRPGASLAGPAPLRPRLLMSRRHK